MAGTNTIAACAAATSASSSSSAACDGPTDVSSSVDRVNNNNDQEMRTGAAADYSSDRGGTTAATQQQQQSEEGEPFHQVTLDDTLLLIPKRYQDLNKLGYGAQGFVCSAFDTVEQKSVAIKKLHRPFCEVTQAKHAYRELKLLKSVQHKNVISLLNAFTPQRTLKEFTDFYIVMELMDGNLSQVVRADLNHERISYLVYQMLCGVRYLHAVGISHRDIKPSNLGATKMCTLKVLDFGLARCGAANSFMKTQYVVTRYYRAPEVILGMDYDERVDIWSIGCCFGELIKKKIVFPGVCNVDQYTKIIQSLGTPKPSFLQRLQHGVRAYLEERYPHEKGYPFEELFPDSVFPVEQDNSPWANTQRASGQTTIRKASELARDLLSKMLVIDPDCRISIDDALQHPYLNVWMDESDKVKPSPVQYDQTIEERDYDVQHWKELVFLELVDYAQSHDIFGDGTNRGGQMMTD